MWVVFLLSSFAFAILAILLMYIGNKVMNAMKKDNHRLEKHIKQEEKKNE